MIDRLTDIIAWSWIPAKIVGAYNKRLKKSAPQKAKLVLKKERSLLDANWQVWMANWKLSRSLRMLKLRLASFII